jgi:hypothetical protein
LTLRSLDCGLVSLVFCRPTEEVVRTMNARARESGRLRSMFLAFTLTPALPVKARSFGDYTTVRIRAACSQFLVSRQRPRRHAIGFWIR